MSLVPWVKVMSSFTNVSMEGVERKWHVCPASQLLEEGVVEQECPYRMARIFTGMQICKARNNKIKMGLSLFKIRRFTET